MKEILMVVAFLLSQFSPKTSNIPINANQATVILTGDIMLGRTVMTTSLDKSDPTYPFIYVAETLKNADLVFANLENPIIENCPRHTTGFKFCADPKMLEGLTYSGIDVVTIANNHTKNYGNSGFEETKFHLQQNDISVVGEGSLAIKEIDGIKFGFLGFDFLTNKPQEKDFQLVKDSDPEADVLIVGVHWGVEYKDTANAFQVETAQKLIESGADVIAGHHPHWIQNTEYIEGPLSPDGSVESRPVYYSLGNFVFDQMWSEETKKGLVMKLTFEGKELASEERLPIYMQNWAQPAFD